ncbi:hypothetical protein E4H12_01935 [Candidatus Thorarchaeota archaeon]|nr:MAG: hypothetical protein E4H12_01935 [Candidatus Thorarchaeota archaeon]
MIDYYYHRRDSQRWFTALVGLTIFLFFSVIGVCAAYVIEIPAPEPFQGSIAIDVDALPPLTMEDYARGCPRYTATVKIDEMEVMLPDTMNPFAKAIVRIKILDGANPEKCQAI